MICVEINITGIVQGVGFRPFIYKTAINYFLKGYVTNDSKGVIIEFEGHEEDINRAIEYIKNNNPRGSFIQAISVEEIEIRNYKGFIIQESIKNSANKISMSPDLGICNDCKIEIEDEHSRFYNYPFISCASCGPRLTILENLPYDRPYTSMSDFEMCSQCESEYTNPLDRRYHAQTISCPKCGPSLWMESGNSQPIEYTIELLKRGKIVAIKGIGGYHLACDGENFDAINLLRQRKKRDAKPFAVMMNLDIAKRHCDVSDFEEELLLGHQNPIVLLKLKENSNINKNINPRINDLGVMLPYTGIHKLIMDKFNVLVMTSANISEEPIILQENEAKDKLHNVADDYLSHNRRITVGCDDSVIRGYDNKIIIIRRSRGFAPVSFSIKSDSVDILACGSDLKNTFCIYSKDNAYMSPHIGDLMNVNSFDRFTNNINYFNKILGTNFKYVVCDYHPNFQSSKYANSLNIPVIKVQHHHAHIVSCMVENNMFENVIGIAFDGTGYGDDGNIWGGEVFTANRLEYEREFHFEYLKMPGGELAAKEPWRMGISYLQNSFDSLPNIHFLDRLEKEKLNQVSRLLNSNINWPLTSSCGRLFDAISSIVGLVDINNYEGQGAIMLENSVVKSDYEYDFEIIGDIIYTKEMIRQIVFDIQNGITKNIIASKFHNTLARVILVSSKIIRNNKGINIVVLSGGVFQNMILLEKTMELLKFEGFKVYFNVKVPLNDGGISLGQIASALEKIKR